MSEPSPSVLPSGEPGAGRVLPGSPGPRTLSGHCADRPSCAVRAAVSSTPTAKLGRAPVVGTDAVDARIGIYLSDPAHLPTACRRWRVVSAMARIKPAATTKTQRLVQLNPPPLHRAART